MLSQLRVGVVQMRFGRRMGENLAKIEKAVGQASRKRADAVLFPETATTGSAVDFARLERKEIREALTHVGNVAKANHIHVLMGSPVFRKRGLCNCLVQFDRDGIAIRAFENAIYYVFANSAGPRDDPADTPAKVTARSLPYFGARGEL